MDYRERARRIISEEEAARAELSRRADERIKENAERDEAIRSRLEAARVNLDRLRLREMLEAANEGVWEGYGRIRITDEDNTFFSDRFSTGPFTRRAILSAHIPKIVPNTIPVTRPGIIRIQTKPWETYGPDQLSTGGSSFRFIGMKKTGDRIVGAKDVGRDTTLTIEIYVPISKKTGRVKVTDSEFDWEAQIGGLDGKVYKPPQLVGLPYGTYDTNAPYDYYVGGKRTPYIFIEEERAIYGSDYSKYFLFPSENFDPAQLERYIDTAILLSSTYRIREPLSRAYEKAEADRAAIMKRVGEKIPYPYETVVQAWRK